MPRVNRSELCAVDEIQAFHLINRCVRWTYLCGKDRRSRKDYSHRKEWIRSRLEELAGIFGIDVLGFAVLSNHMHVVVRTRPDVVKAWSDDEVALRWWRLYPQPRSENGRKSSVTSLRTNAESPMAVWNWSYKVGGTQAPFARKHHSVVDGLPKWRVRRNRTHHDGNRIGFAGLFASGLVRK